MSRETEALGAILDHAQNEVAKRRGEIRAAWELVVAAAGRGLVEDIEPPEDQPSEEDRIRACIAAQPPEEPMPPIFLWAGMDASGAFRLAMENGGALATGQTADECWRWIPLDYRAANIIPQWVRATQVGGRLYRPDGMWNQRVMLEALRPFCEGMSEVATTTNRPTE